MFELTSFPPFPPPSTFRTWEQISQNHQQASPRRARRRRSSPDLGETTTRSSGLTRVRASRRSRSASPSLLLPGSS